MADGQTNGSTAMPRARDPDFYAGYSRFEIELEFVQSLSNPYYLHYLAAQKYFDNEEFVNYLAYLQYFQEPKYRHYLQYPDLTLKAIELLQQERFRKDLLNPALPATLAGEWFEAATKGVDQK